MTQSLRVKVNQCQTYIPQSAIAPKLAHFDAQEHMTYNTYIAGTASGPTRPGQPNPVRQNENETKERGLTALARPKVSRRVSKNASVRPEPGSPEPVEGLTTNGLWKGPSRSAPSAVSLVPIAEMSQNVPECHKIATSTEPPSALSAPSAVSPVPIAEMQQNATLCNKNRTFFLQLRDLRALCGEPPHTGSSVSIGTPAELPHSVHEPS